MGLVGTELVPAGCRKVLAGCRSFWQVLPNFLARTSEDSGRCGPPWEALKLRPGPTPQNTHHFVFFKNVCARPCPLPLPFSPGAPPRRGGAGVVAAGGPPSSGQSWARLWQRSVSRASHPLGAMRWKAGKGFGKGRRTQRRWNGPERSK